MKKQLYFSPDKKKGVISFEFPPALRTIRYSPSYRGGLKFLRIAIPYHTFFLNFTKTQQKGIKWNTCVVLAFHKEPLEQTNQLYTPYLPNTNVHGLICNGTKHRVKSVKTYGEEQISHFWNSTFNDDYSGTLKHNYKQLTIESISELTRRNPWSDKSMPFEMAVLMDKDVLLEKLISGWYFHIYSRLRD